MATHARAIGMLKAIQPDWEMVKAWAKATFTRERIREAALCTATVTFAGVLVFSLHKAMEHYIILGF